MVMEIRVNTESGVTIIAKSTKQEFDNVHKVSDGVVYLILSAYAFSLVVLGFIISPPGEILSGLLKIIIEPDFLISDYFIIGGVGATFVNSGLLSLMVILLLYRTKISPSGVTNAAVWLIAGFALFGKNIFNVWFIIIGVALYARYQRDNFGKYINIALFGAALSPLVTQIMFGLIFPAYLRIPLGIILGLFIGFIISPLATFMMRVHQGFNLYNIGFTAGFIGTVLVSILRSYGLDIPRRAIWATGQNRILIGYLFFIFISQIILGFLLNNRSFARLGNIYKTSGRLVSDYIILEGIGPSLINMGINGLFGTIYLLVIRGDFNGPTIGGIFTIVGFSAFGKHLKNMVPIFLGVMIGAITKVWSLNDPAIQLAALFGTTLAPIAGEFGWQYGILAGFIHSSVVLNVGVIHGGMNLFNNGFAGGLVATVLVPIIEAFRKEE